MMMVGVMEPALTRQQTDATGDAFGAWWRVLTSAGDEMAERVPLIGPALTSTSSTVQVALRRVGALMGLLDRAGTALDDIAELRHSAQSIANNLAELTHAAQGIDVQAGQLTTEIKAVSQIMPTLERLTEIVDPLDTTVARLGRFVDRLPGGRRAASRPKGSLDGSATDPPRG
ncbi:hypothetical protein PT015_17750 [Candidatus Mycobacterium wuenschmannii]|uniref:Uncharacterized protein n=1 Tax=Candidatus Mycobacterium wuenschmannii TaxID=3027808 RepID=A0ABY8VV94_9MYCO|nr:hypothetical protein [Candidatus Mycobacterium wuenschmannii]WIM86714.1 hypothetical protein PT015_17750 [Candidatus Mycobacterium wuenschmannii]